MKPSALGAAFLVAGIALSAIAQHHTLTPLMKEQQFAFLTPAPAPAEPARTMFVGMTQGTNVPFLAIPARSTNTLLFIPYESKRARQAQLPAPEPLKPGVYETKPYSGIVVVPGPHPDDKCIFGGQGNLKMPTKVPDLQLTPRSTPTAPKPATPRP